MQDQHSKVRFKKQKSKWWRYFPSAQQKDNVKVKTKRSFKIWRRRIRKTLTIFLSVLFVLFLIFFIILKIGISGQFIKDKMQTIVSNKVFTFTDVTISDAKISINNKLDIVLEVNDLNFAHTPSGVTFKKINSLNLDLSTLQLLKGNIELKDIEFSGALIDIQSSQDGLNFWALLPKTENGQLDIDQLQTLLFSGSEAIFSKLDQQAIKQFTVKDFIVSLPSKTDDKKTIKIDKIVANSEPTSFKIQAAFEYGKSATNLDGIIIRNDQGKADSIELKVNNFAAHIGADENAPVFFPDGRLNAMLFRLDGIVNIDFISQRLNAKTQKPLTKLTLSLENGKADIADEADLPANLNMAIKYQGDKQSITILPSEINLAGLHIPFEGDLKTAEDIDTTSINTNLLFNITSHDGKISANTIDKHELSMNSQLSGYFDIEAKKLVLDDLNLTLPSGILSAQGDLTFGQGTPAINFNLKTDEIGINDAKRLWPINVAPGGRRWVTAHLFDGKLKNGSIRVTLPQAFFVEGKPIHPLTIDEVEINTLVEGASADTYGELPKLEQGSGSVHVEGQKTTIKLEKGISTLDTGCQVHVKRGELIIPWGIQRPVYADLNITLASDTKAAGDALHLKPIAVAKKLPFDPEKTVGDLIADIKVHFPITRDNPPGTITWQSDVNFNNFTPQTPIEGMQVKDASGTAHITKEGAIINGKGLLNDFPSTVTIVQPFDNSTLKKQENIIFSLDDKIREKQLPFLNTFISGPINVNVGENKNNLRHIQVDLNDVTVSFPWVNWIKGKGIAAKAQFDIPANFSKVNTYTIQNFILEGNNFIVSGDITIENKQFKSANFKKANLNRGDDISLLINYDKNSYQIKVDGNAYDVRSLIKSMGKTGNKSTSNDSINVAAKLKKVTGFNDENLFNVTTSYASQGQNNNITITAVTGAKLPMSIAIGTKQNQQYVDADSADAGVLLRFVDYYDKLHSGNLMARLSSNNKNEPLSGPVKIKNFLIVDEKKLEVLVANTAANRGPNPKNPNIISSRIPFEIVFAHIGKGESYLVVDNGILRGEAVGASFQGIVFDASGNMNLTGTFMPAYSVNRLFSEVPLIGKVLGNGRDRGLIGITFKIEGNLKTPNIIINPVSAIAPGILRQVFEFQ